MRIFKKILKVKANLPFLINPANFPSKESNEIYGGIFDLA